MEASLIGFGEERRKHCPGRGAATSLLLSWALAATSVLGPLFPAAAAEERAEDGVAAPATPEETAGAAEETPQAPPTAPQPPPGALGTGRNWINISLDALVAAGGSSEPDVTSLQLGSHDPSRRGFTLQNLELVIDGAVDPYFRAQGNIIFVETPEGETEIEVEEIYATTTHLPHDLQVKAGHFFTEFGRLNPQHPHFWDFVDQPLVHARMFGPDNLRASGVRVSWLAPLPFYSELYLAILNAGGETLRSFGFVEGETLFGRDLRALEVRSLQDLLYVPRWSVSFDLTGNQTLLGGVSAALGPNATGPEGNTAIWGVDLFWKWKSPRAVQGFPFLKAQLETMRRRYRADQPREVFEDHGTYVQLVWGFQRGWTVGARYGRVGGDEGTAADDPFFEDRWRASLAVSWFPTEYSKLRLQYNRDERTSLRAANSLWLQLEFILGAHAAHKF